MELLNLIGENPGFPLSFNKKKGKNNTLSVIPAQKTQHHSPTER